MVKAVRVIGTSALFLLLGWTVPANSRQEPQEKPKNQEKQQQAKPGRKQSPPAKAARQDKPQANRQQQQQPAKQQNQQRQQQANRQQTQQRQQQQANTARQQQANTGKQQQANRQQGQQRQQQQDTRSVQQRSPAQVHEQQVAWQGDRANRWESEHRSWQQRGGYNGYRVPDDRFRAYYGQDHYFRFYNLPVRFVGGHRRFQYGGFWFGFVDPWPEYWANNWYDNDDVYVDYYGDGYYLRNRRYPNDRIAISFYLNLN